jgi:Transposase protein
MQILHKPQSQWLEDEKQLAPSMYYESPALYNDLRKNKGFNLPSKQTIEGWMNVLDLQAGICSDLMKKMKLKMSGMSLQERQCILMFDEMSIKRVANIPPSTT